MLVKLDENLSSTHAEFLRQAGYDCDRASEERSVSWMVAKLIDKALSARQQQQEGADNDN
jgi:CopG-like RHH_1 or ribbon-helix-helix domain, RHH_5